MSIHAVTDIFAFACAHPEYWELLRSDDDIPELGTDERRAAFAAAREHVLSSVEALLRASLRAIQSRVPEAERTRYLHLPRQGVKSPTTRANCYVSTLFLQGRGKQSWLNIAMEKSWDERQIRLYASIQSNLENIRSFQSQYPPTPPATEAQGNFYYFGDLEIRQADDFVGLGERLAQVTWPGVERFTELISPPERG